MQKLITIINPRGATYGYGGPFVSVNTVVLFDGQRFHGHENLIRTFGGQHLLITFLTGAANKSVGDTGTHDTPTHQIVWSVETHNA